MNRNSLALIIAGLALATSVNAAEAPAAAPATAPVAPVEAVVPVAADAAAAPSAAPAVVELAPAAPLPRIGIVMTAVPKVDVDIVGAGCLLCYATAAAANSSLSTHAEQLGPEDIPQLKDMVMAAMRAAGREPVLIAEPVDIKKLKKMKVKKGSQTVPRDFTGYKQSHEIDELLVIEVAALGFHRSYSAYVPTSDPKAMVKLSLFQVNLADNTYVWQEPIEVLRSAESKWDEAPAFPGLTNAYYQAIENAKDLVLAKFPH